MSALSIDPLWPRAGDWPASTREETLDAVLLGVPAWRTGRPAEPGGIHLDIDVDVCDRSVAPGRPASVPGGLAAWELWALVRGIAHDPRVASADIVEVDATADTADARTVRLAALCVLELLAGLAERP